MGRPVREIVGVAVVPVTVMVQVLELPACTLNPLPQDEEIDQLAVTVNAMVVVAVSVPEVPVMVMVDVAAAAVLATVKVITLVEVAGLVPIVAVTPVGRPETARVTPLANGLTSVTVMVSVPLAPWAIDSVAAEGLSEKLPVEDETTVSGKVVVAVVVPEVPVMVIVAVPTVAVAVAVHVITLVVVIGFGEKVQVTPLGRPVKVGVTLPEKPPISVTVMVSDAVLP